MSCISFIMVIYSTHLGTRQAFSLYWEQSHLFITGKRGPQSVREEDKANDYQNVTISANEINMVIQFLLFGLAMDMKNPNMLVCVILFVIFCTGIIIMEAVLIKQIKKIHPLKNGDVGDTNFNKRWMDSCDEAERMIIYKASYSTFQVMKSMLPIMEAVALLGKLMFGTGNFPIILICIIWGVHTGVYCFGSMKLEKEGIE